MVNRLHQRGFDHHTHAEGMRLKPERRGLHLANYPANLHHATDS